MLLSIRLQDVPLHELLYAESAQLSQKLDERRARAAAEMAHSCTFAPVLVSQQLVKHGRVMQVCSTVIEKAGQARLVQLLPMSFGLAHAQHMP